MDFCNNKHRLIYFESLDGDTETWVQMVVFRKTAKKTKHNLMENDPSALCGQTQAAICKYWYMGFLKNNNTKFNLMTEILCWFSITLCAYTDEERGKRLHLKPWLYRITIKTKTLNVKSKEKQSLCAVGHENMKSLNTLKIPIVLCSSQKR